MRSGVERLARRPVEAAARSSRSVLAAELDRALTLLLAGSIPERVVQGVIDHRVVERIVEQAAPAQLGDDDWAAVERAVERVLADERVARGATQLAERVVSSAAFEHALASVLESPEVRRAARSQAVGFRSELGTAVRRRCARWDDAVSARARRLLQRDVSGEGSAFGGIAARGLALVLDLALAGAGFAAAVGAAALVGSLVGLGARPLVAAVGLGAFWTVVAVCYFVTFWSATGQTPGMRALRLRVVTVAGEPPSVPRSCARAAALLVSIVVPFVAFVPALVDGRRRALPDLITGTIVVVDADPDATYRRVAVDQSSSS